MPYKTPEAKRRYHAEYMRERYATDEEFRNKQKERVAARNKLARKYFKQFLRDKKQEAGCAICGEREACCLVFHHLDPTQKEFELGRNSGRHMNWKALMDEIDKCVVLCFNCHSKVHAGLLQIPVSRSSSAG